MSHSLNAPRFLVASTAKALERKMLENNIKRRSRHTYSIVYDGKSWYGWYDVDLNGALNTEINEILGEEKPTGG